MSGLHARLDRDLARARARVLALTDIDDAELTAQHSPLMSPLVWDLAHIANQEERWLLRAAGGHAGEIGRASWRERVSKFV